MSTSRSGSLVDSPQVRGFSVSSRNALLLSGLLSVDRIAKRRFSFCLVACSLLTCMHSQVESSRRRSDRLL